MKKVKETNTEVLVVESVATVKGRKVNPDSARQQRLAKQGTGEVKRGRPTSGTSARQARLAELAAKRESGELKKGRPVNTTSARQLRLANAGTTKRGRPAKSKVEQNDIVTLERG